MLNTLVNSKITIIGAGWLGAPLSSALLQSNHDVIATKQSEKSLNEIKTKFEITNIPHKELLQFKCFSDEILKKTLTDEAFSSLFHQRKIIITIPPTPFIQRYSIDNIDQGIADYKVFIQKIMQLAEKFGALEVIYTSSISVYGNSSGIIHEALPAMPQTNSAKAIYQVEQLLQNSHLPVTILRLAGLIGHGRHPVFSLQGRNNIQSPFNAINLLHIQDLINAIIKIMARDKSLSPYKIYNVVTPIHPNRQSYYQTLARLLNLPLPQFESPKPELRRIIDGSKITELGDFHYEVIDLLHASLDKLI